MGRPRKKPEYDHEKIMNEVLDGMVQAYKQLDKSQRSGGNLSYGALKDLADEMDIKPSKIRKLLITAGVRDNKQYYENDASRLVLSLYNEGKSNAEIMKITGLGRSSVLGYLPYKKGVYRASELSTDAERIKLYRERCRRCQEFVFTMMGMNIEDREQYLWDTISYHQMRMVSDRWILIWNNRVLQYSGRTGVDHKSSCAFVLSRACSGVPSRMAWTFLQTMSSSCRYFFSCF